MPFHGVAHVGYIPSTDGKITGLSKLARLVDVFARRPQVQERLTTQIADSLMEILEPRGVIVVVECEHMCMSMRGIRKPGREDDHLGGARPAAGRGHPRRGDEPDHGALSQAGRRCSEARRAGAHAAGATPPVLSSSSSGSLQTRSRKKAAAITRDAGQDREARRRWPGRGGRGRPS